MFISVSKSSFNKLIAKYKKIQKDFLNEFGVDDIISNSKIYEILIADSLNHILIPGHSGSKDAKDQEGNLFEYKHYKETSSNHSWTFNDYTDNTIENLKLVKFVIFAHINDTTNTYVFDWYYAVSGTTVSKYLHEKTTNIENQRKMINVSPKQIEQIMGIKRITVDSKRKGQYSKYIKDIIKVSRDIEKLTGTTGILTSNKLWEVLIAVELGHKVNSEQGGRSGAHDAFDKEGNCYEYKISKTHSWSFQDISKNVLQKYLSDKKIILAVVDKQNYSIKNIFSAEPRLVVKLLKKKLEDKIKRYKSRRKTIRRIQATITKTDLQMIAEKLI
ncbi:MAG: hypothetical protein OXJ52_09735 [Oligoflexia bacterium]|nr:hypothetical protein [Oligoflexia bacterium]